MPYETRFNPILALLVAWFGSVSWLAGNALFVEMGIYAQRLPEGWRIGSIVTVIFQVSAVVGLAYVYVERCTRVRVRHARLILAALAVAALGLLPLAFAGETRVWWWGAPRSLVLYAACGAVGGVAVLGDVLFLPYLHRLPAPYLRPYFVGMGCSALVPCLVGLAQGASTYDCVPSATNSSHLEPVFSHVRFSVAIFYLIIFGWSALGVAAFALLHWERDAIERLWTRLSGSDADGTPPAPDRPVASVAGKRAQNGVGRDRAVIALIMVVSCCVTTFMPSIQSFVVLPYSSVTYFWSLCLVALAQPLGAFSTYVARARSLRTLCGLTALTVALAGVALCMAFQSPHPWLQGTTVGSLLALAIVTSIYLLGCHCRAVLFELYREDSDAEQQHRRLLVAGFFGQVGSTLGTLFLFPAVNVFGLFKSAPSC